MPSSTTLSMVRVKLKDLRPHPRQPEIFTCPTEDQIASLAEDMRLNGQQHPIEVLPDLVIIAGHCRVEAARRNKWDEIDAVIRHDLAEQGEAAIERYMIADNFHRRQLRPLERARCALRLKQLAAQRRRSRGLLAHEEAGVRQNTREWVGRTLGIGGREVSRLLRVLETPVEIQEAFEFGELSLDLAGKVAGLDAEDQEEIAEAIQDGEDPKEVVTEFVRAATVERQGVMPAFRKLLREINAAVAVLADRVHRIDVDGAKVDEQVAVCQRGIELLESITRHQRDTQQRREENTMALLERVEDELC